MKNKTGGKMEIKDGLNSKARILDASIELFTKNGFSATLIEDIAKKAKANKALIYYYFNSKEGILDYMVQELLKTASFLAVSFIRENIVKLIKSSKLEVKNDQYIFKDKATKNEYMRQIKEYHEKLYNFAMENRIIIRILLHESCSKTRTRNDLFKLLSLIERDDENPIFRALTNEDNTINYSDDVVLFKLFFSYIPLIYFTVYYDDYKKATGATDEQARKSFLQSFQTVPFHWYND